MDGRSHTAVLLVNTGTVAAPTAAAAGKFLKEFLNDPKVVSLPSPLRKLLVNGFIVPRRARHTAAAYQRIWQTGGSPLLVEMTRLEQALGAELADARVVLAMRYGEPSVPRVLRSLNESGCRRVVVLPLFPQYADATTGSAIAAVTEALQRYPDLSVDFVSPFFDRPEFIEALADHYAPLLKDFAPEHILFSYHGLPERHIHRSDPTGKCLVRPDCCIPFGPHNRHCYRAQCVATTDRVTTRLGLDKTLYTTTFQSRMGPMRWIGPSTTETVDTLASAGIRRLAVACPSFVVDNLETLEEIGIRLREQFMQTGGEDFLLLPSLNSASSWVRALASILKPVLD